jgi:hypothetical protein
VSTLLKRIMVLGLCSALGSGLLLGTSLSAGAAGKLVVKALRVPTLVVTKAPQPRVNRDAVTVSGNQAFFNWSDPGVTGIQSATIAVSASDQCNTAVNWLFNSATFIYPASSNTTSANVSVKGKNNSVWVYAGSSTYSATVTVTNSVGAKATSSCVIFAAGGGNA